MQGLGRLYIRRRPNKGMKWPNDAKIAVILTFDFQGQVGHHYYPYPNGKTNLHEVKSREYGAVAGIWRVLDILDKHGIRGTFPTCGRTAEIYPDATREIRKRGHEIAAHAYLHEKLYELTRDMEREVMMKTIAALEKVTGEKPRGWRSPWNYATEHTIELNMELGFAWNSDFHDDDIPYTLERNGKTILEIPPSADDWKMYLDPSFTGKLFFNYLKDEFDVLYGESTKKPIRFTVTYHPLIVGRPERSKYLDELITYMKGFEGVWFARCTDVADWWIKNSY